MFTNRQRPTYRVNYLKFMIENARHGHKIFFKKTSYQLFGFRNARKNFIFMNHKIDIFSNKLSLKKLFHLSFNFTAI